ncbi:MAG: YIP1 family protein [Verrucomicrobia bacterium]|nr:YIP1 family protein [Verrucomicrobiota bacterium]
MAKSVEGNPWLRIWTEPKKTIRSIVNTDSKYGFLILSAIYGLPLAFNLAQSIALASVIPVWAVLIGSLVVCTFLGMIGISISAWLLQFTGRWIGGKGNFQSVRAAVAWSNVPNFVTVLMWIVLLGVFGAQVFNKDFSETQFIGYQAGILFLVMLIESIVSIWGFIILLNGLAEVHGFSVWRALLNVLIPFVLIVAIIWLAGWAIWGTGAVNN